MPAEAIETYVERMGPFPTQTVCFVGTGPGDGGLLTIRGACRIQQADVVVHAASESPAWRTLVRRDALLVFAGRADGSERIKPDAFLNIVKPHVEAGRRVVRLKSGDPFVFNRTEEECEALASVGIGFEIVPGVTSGLAGPAFAGIGTTHPGMADAVTLVIGYDDPESAAAKVDYAQLARGGTVVVYFGESHLGGICRQMIARGADADTPVAIIHDATKPSQRVQIATLAEYESSQGVPRPAIIVIGTAVETRRSLAWRDSLPLADRSVLVTRPETQAAGLVGRLAAAGAEVLEAPTLRVVRLTDDAVLREAIAAIHRYDWLVLTSVNGVDALAWQLRMVGLDARSLAGVHVAVVGPSTAERLNALFIKPDLVPRQYLTSALGRELIATGVKGARILLLRSSEANDELPAMLVSAGAVCDSVVGYEAAAVNALPVDVMTRIIDDTLDWATFTSPSTFCNFHDILNRQSIPWPTQLRVASIGPVTSAAMRERGVDPTVEATEHTIAGLADALIEFVSGITERRETTEG